MGLPGSSSVRSTPVSTVLERGVLDGTSKSSGELGVGHWLEEITFDIDTDCFVSAWASQSSPDVESWVLFGGDHGVGFNGSVSNVETNLWDVVTTVVDLTLGVHSDVLEAIN